MEAGYRGRTKGKGFEQRVREVAAVLTECGYMAEVESMNPDEFLLTLGNCAIREVAERFPEACEGTGMSPPPSTRHSSSPVLKS